MDIMLTVLSIDKEVSDSRDVTNVKSENICTTEIDSSNDEFKCMESIEENSSASEEEEESLIKIICPLAQDEIAICDEAEKSSNNHDILETINSQKEVVILESNSQSDLCLKVTETPDEQLCTEEPLSLRPTPCNVHDSLNGNVVIQDNMARDNLTLSRASSYQEPMLSNTSPNANVFLSSSSSPSTPSSFGSSKRHSMDPLSFAPQFWPSTPSPILPSPPSTCSERCDEVVCVTMASSSLAFSTASGCPDVESHNKTLKTQIDNCVSAVSDNCCKSTPVTSTKVGHLICQCMLYQFEVLSRSLIWSLAGVTRERERARGWRKHGFLLNKKDNQKM